MNPSCRRDDAGVTWPSRYDRHIVEPRMWLAAGFPTDVPDDFTGSREDIVELARPDSAAVGFLRPYRTANNLDRDEKANIVAAYLGGDSATELAERFRLTYRVILNVVDAAGVPRRKYTPTDD